MEASPCCWASFPSRNELHTLPVQVVSDSSVVKPLRPRRKMLVRRLAKAKKDDDVERLVRKMPPYVFAEMISNDFGVENSDYLTVRA